MKTMTLNNGVEMPIIGYGVFLITDLKECERSVLDALEVGYRSIDTAASYENEEAVGRAIVKSGIPRNELFITTKLWASANGYEGTIRAFYQSLDKLKTDYLDLFLIHQPMGDVYGSWHAMQDLYKKGKIRAIGVSNFHLDRIVDLMLHNEIKPAVNQIETHPFYQQTNTVGYLKNHDIVTEAWSPLASGKKNIFANKVLTTIGEKYNKTIAQVTLRWLIQRGIVAIPKTLSKSRMTENFNVFDFELSEDDMSIIKTLDANESVYFDHRDPEMIKWLKKVEDVNM